MKLVLLVAFLSVFMPPDFDFTESGWLYGLQAGSEDVLVWLYAAIAIRSIAKGFG